MPEANPARYNIGAASRLTGVSREKIRIWERRYGAVTPARDEANLRKYSQQDIERLILIRRLVDSGQAVSNVANLSVGELQSRLQALMPKAEVSGNLPQTALAVLSEGNSLRDALAKLGIPEVGVARTLAEAESWLPTHPVDLIAVEFPTLLRADLTTIKQLRRLASQSQLMVVYRFAPVRMLEQLQTLGIRAVRAPLQAADLHATPQPATSAASGPQAPPRLDYRQRQYTPEQLLAMSNMATQVQCECPRHLADLVRDLSAFEDYSLECETESAADAEMHREVYDIIARARALVEDALGIVAREEDLDP